jgi:2'-5' RNA ligase
MFVALVPPDAALEDLAEFLAPRQEVASGFRWTVPDQWHVTVAFLAQVADRHLDDLQERLRRAASRRTSFAVEIAGGGAFPNPATAKVLYAGVDAGVHAAQGRVELERLATGARAAANRAGAQAAGGRFHPHVTLARIGRPTDVVRWVRVLDTYRGPRWQADALTLVESHLGEGPRRRPRYEVVDRFALGSSAEPTHEPVTGEMLGQ